MDKEIGLLCSGLGRVNRGYERYTQDLFREVGKELPLVLFKGEGPRRAREISVGGWAGDGIARIVLSNLLRDSAVASNEIGETTSRASSAKGI